MTNTTRPTLDGTPVDASMAEPLTGSTEMLTLDRSECLRLVAAAGLGRIVASVPGWDTPVIRPVNYTFDEQSQSVLIRSGSGSKLYALLNATNAAFEIDDFDLQGQVGWSVIIVGITEEITDAAELRRIAGLGLEPWAPGDRGHWIRVRARTISGRRIAPLAPRDPADPSGPSRATVSAWPATSSS